MKASNTPFNNIGLARPVSIAKVRANVYGVLVKTLVLFALFTASFTWSWMNAGMMYSYGKAFFYGLPLLTLVLALYTHSNPDKAIVTAPLYALLQGVLVGFISIFEAMYYPGIALNAALLTCSIFFAMLFLYMSGIITVTSRLMVLVATGLMAVSFVYALNLMLTLFFSTRVPYIHESGPIGIGFSLFVLVIAAFSLLFEFEEIAQYGRNQLNSRIEWYFSFRLIASMIWIYIEVLRLLSKLSGQRKR